MDYAKEYSYLHQQYPKFFAGWSIKRYVDDIAKAVATHDANSLLDYGCGKGYQYLVRRSHDRWGACPHCSRGLLPTLYDVGVRQLAEKPEGTFDGVICTDMLEHIEEKDVVRVLDDLVGYATKFLVLGISCKPEQPQDTKRLSDGRGVHVTVRPPEWWRAQIELALKRDGRQLPLVVYAIYEPLEGPLVKETLRDESP